MVYLVLYFFTSCQKRNAKKKNYIQKGWLFKKRCVIRKCGASCIKLWGHLPHWDKSKALAQCLTHGRSSTTEWKPDSVASSTMNSRILLNKIISQSMFWRDGFLGTTKVPSNMYHIWGISRHSIWGNTAFSGPVFEMYIYTRILSQDNKDIKGFLRCPPVKTSF